MGLNVVIDDDLARFVESRVEAGEYGSPREVVEEALRALKARGEDEASRAIRELADASDDGTVAWLQTAHEEGIASGDAGPLDIEVLIKEARRQHAVVE